MPPAYTVENAIEEAYAALEGRFGNVDQVAVVHLATFLYGAKAQEQFQERREEAGAEVPYGGGFTT